MAAVNVKYRSAVGMNVSCLILSNPTLETKIIYQNTLKSEVLNIYEVRIWIVSPTDRTIGYIV